MISQTDARERMVAANKRYMEAKDESDKAEAILAGLAFLEMAAKYPGVTGFYYTVEQEYDDERYFTQVQVVPEYDQDKEGQEEAENEYGPPEDNDDVVYGWSEEGLGTLIGSTDSTFTLNEIRQKVIDLAGYSGGSED